MDIIEALVAKFEEGKANHEAPQRSTTKPTCIEENGYLIVGPFGWPGEEEK